MTSAVRKSVSGLEHALLIGAPGLIPALGMTLILGLALGPNPAVADGSTAFNGHWLVNEELSDDTDKQVERAIKKGGGKVPRGKKTKGRHRGGPPTQKLYDHLSYDEVLHFEFTDPEMMNCSAYEFSTQDQDITLRMPYLSILGWEMNGRWILR